MIPEARFCGRTLSLILPKPIDEAAKFNLRVDDSIEQVPVAAKHVYMNDKSKTKFCNRAGHPNKPMEAQDELL